MSIYPPGVSVNDPHDRPDTPETLRSTLLLVIRRASAAHVLVVVVAIVVALAGCGDGDEHGSAAASEGPSTACGSGAPVNGRPLRIATTVAPITSIVANIAGGTDTSISGIVPEGVNSHTYEPAPSVAATLERADVLFLNGLMLEEPTRALALANRSDGAEVCQLGTSVLPEDEYIFDASFPGGAGRPNPHLWTNPVMAKQYAEVVRDVLVARDPADAPTYRSNYEAFAARVDALDAAVRDATLTVARGRRRLLTYHDGYAYFAREYGWQVLGAIQPSSFDEPTPREVAELIEQVRASGVPAIFGSEEFPSSVLEQIASETGAAYVDDLRDDDLPGAPGDPDHSWLGLMRSNVGTMIDALGGDASSLEALDVTDVVPDEAVYAQ
jgi:ABC-type Zn uptake system ZnuABC Zn-binding protein ZnuA